MLNLYSARCRSSSSGGLGAASHPCSANLRSCSEAGFRPDADGGLPDERGPLLRRGPSDWVVVSGIRAGMFVPSDLPDGGSGGRCCSGGEGAVRSDGVNGWEKNALNASAAALSLEKAGSGKKRRLPGRLAAPPLDDTLRFAPAGC